MFFPATSGRRSGILSFDIGQFQNNRRFVRNIGYYYAPNDYIGTQAAFDIDEDYGVKLRTSVNYALRYKFTGSLNAAYWLDNKTEWEGTRKSTRYELRYSHTHTFSDVTRFTASGSFVSI